MAMYTINSGTFSLDMPMKVDAFMREQDIGGNIHDGLGVMETGDDWAFEVVFVPSEFYNDQETLSKVECEVRIHIQPPPSSVLNKLIDTIQSSNSAEDLIERVRVVDW